MQRATNLNEKLLSDTFSFFVITLNEVGLTFESLNC